MNLINKIFIKKDHESINCDTCFVNEYSLFDSEKKWLEFDLELTKKLGSDKMKYLKFKNDGKRDKDDGVNIYECTNCKQKWKLRDPDYSDRGYFKKI